MKRTCYVLFTLLLLAGLIAEPPVPLRREHFEEVFPLLMRILMGYKP